MPRYCRVCGETVPDTPSEPPYQPRFECRVCGTYRLSERAAQGLFEVAHWGGALQPYLAENHHLLSAVIRDRYERGRRREVFVPDFEEVRGAAIAIDNPFEAVDRILLHVARTAARIGDEVTIIPETDYPIGFARDAEEFGYYIQLGAQIGFLEVHRGYVARPSPDGWRRLNQLRLRDVDPDSAFVAMRFSDELRNVYAEGIQPALHSTGFRSIRLDLIEHNGKIDDRIIADIRKSLLVIADFTGQGQNVYFEAGLALGLGRHVIWTCRESDFDQVHFDTRQYNHVVWSDAADLKTRLQNRIEATIPRDRSVGTHDYDATLH
jgi:hypothetical protein